ncbi:MAG: aldo/keto reductase, partial [Bacteroidales bacterium]|nr:aldo/keto reductase [Bacteroidales bacterium]
MKYRRCGKSGLLLSEIALGFWQNFGADADYEECRKIVQYAFDHGVTYFDLANNYGPPCGAAEEMFG